MLISQPVESCIYSVPVRITEDSILRHVEVDENLRPDFIELENDFFYK